MSQIYALPHTPGGCGVDVRDNRLNRDLYVQTLIFFGSGLRKHILNRRRLKVGFHFGYPINAFHQANDFLL